MTNLSSKHALSLHRCWWYWSGHECDMGSKNSVATELASQSGCALTWLEWLLCRWILSSLSVLISARKYSTADTNVRRTEVWFLRRNNKKFKHFVCMLHFNVLGSLKKNAWFSISLIIRINITRESQASYFEHCMTNMSHNADITPLKFNYYIQRLVVWTMAYCLSDYIIGTRESWDNLLTF